MIKRVVMLIVGFIILLFGLLLLPTPIPIGIIFIILGLSLLVNELPSLALWLKRLRRRYPVTSVKLHSVQHRLPKFAQRLLEQTNPDDYDR